MAIPTDKQIRAAIKLIIDNGLTNYYSGATIPRVFGRWPLDLNVGENPNVLKALTGNTQGKIDAWLIGIDGIGRVRPDQKDGYLTGSLQKMGPNLRIVSKSYKIWRVRFLDVGTEDSNTENSLIEEIEYISDQFSKFPDLNLNNNAVRGHGELQFGPIDSVTFGKEAVLLAPGSLELVINRNLI